MLIVDTKHVDPSVLEGPEKGEEKVDLEQARTSTSLSHTYQTLHTSRVFYITISTTVSLKNPSLSFPSKLDTQGRI